VTLSGIEAVSDDDGSSTCSISMRRWNASRCSTRDRPVSWSLRYFGGLSIDETAEALEISPATVKREWATAAPGFNRELSARGDPDPDSPPDGPCRRRCRERDSAQTRARAAH